MQPKENVFEQLNQQNADDVTALKTKQDQELNELKAHVQAIFINHGEEPITDEEYNDIRKMSSDLRTRHDKEADVLYAFQKQRMINFAAEHGIELPEFIETKPGLATTSGESYETIWNIWGADTPDISQVLADMVIFLKNQTIRAVPAKRKGINIVVPMAHIYKHNTTRLVPVKSFLPKELQAIVDQRMSMALQPYKEVMTTLTNIYNRDVNLTKNINRMNKILKEDEVRRKVNNELQLW